MKTALCVLLCVSAVFVLSTALHYSGLDQFKTLNLVEKKKNLDAPGWYTAELVVGARRIKFNAVFDSSTGVTAVPSTDLHSVDKARPVYDSLNSEGCVGKCDNLNVTIDGVAVSASEAMDKVDFSSKQMRDLRLLSVTDPKWFNTNLARHIDARIGLRAIPNRKTNDNFVRLYFSQCPAFPQEVGFFFPPLKSTAAGKVTFGEQNTRSYKPIETFKTVDAGSWKIPMKVTYHKTAHTIRDLNVTEVLINPGEANIVLPKRIISILFDKYEQSPCQFKQLLLNHLPKSKLPTLLLHISDKETISITPDQYLFTDSNRVLRGTISYHEQDHIVLGVPFMRNRYTVFQYTDHHVKLFDVKQE